MPNSILATNFCLCCVHFEVFRSVILHLRLFLYFFFCCCCSLFSCCRFFDVASCEIVLVYSVYSHKRWLNHIVSNVKRQTFPVFVFVLILFFRFFLSFNFSFSIFFCRHLQFPTVSHSVSQSASQSGSGISFHVLCAFFHTFRIFETFINLLIQLICLIIPFR